MHTDGAPLRRTCELLRKLRARWELDSIAKIRAIQGPSSATSPPSRVSGFTLLEAIVALAVFTAAAMSLYGLFSANLMAMSRVQDASVQLPVVRQAMQHLSLTNPRQQEAGQFQIDGFDVAWSARLIHDVRRSQSSTGFSGDYEVGLYEVTLEMRRDGRVVGAWPVRLVGYERVRAADVSRTNTR